MRFTRSRAAIVGVALLAPPVVASCDWSQYCGGYGNEAKGCASYLLGGTPENVPPGRGMARWNQPDPTPAERASCESTVSSLYGGQDEVRRLYAIEGCRALVNYGTRNKPAWGPNQAWTVLP